MMGKFQRTYNGLRVRSNFKFIRGKEILSILAIILLSLALGSIVLNQGISAQPFSELRIIVHLFSEPHDSANITIRDNDSSYNDSKIATTGLDGSAIVEFRAQGGEIGRDEPFYIKATSNSSKCGDVYGYNKPAYVPEYVDLYLIACDLT